MTFGERIKLALENLSKQGPVTLEMARKQAEEVKRLSKSKNKKQ